MYLMSDNKHILNVSNAILRGFVWQLHELYIMPLLHVSQRECSTYRNNIFFIYLPITFLPPSPSPTLTCPSPSSHLEWPQSVCISYTNISSPSFSLPLFPPFSPIPCSLYLSACIQHYCLFSIHILLIISSSTPFILVLFIPIHTSNNIILFNSRFIIQQRQDNDRKQRMISTINALFTFL